MVIVFFLLSAFVISSSFEKKSSLIQFAKIRLLRIYIPFLASVLISTIVLFFCNNYLINDFDGSEFPKRMIISYNNIDINMLLHTLVFRTYNGYLGFNFAYWSLFHEAIYYILCPFYIKLNTKMLIYLTCVFYFIAIFFHLKILYYQSFFVIGTLIYKYLYQQEKKIMLSKFTLCLLIIVFYCIMNVFVKFNMYYFGDAICILLYISGLYVLLTTKIVIPKILAMISTQSYSLYLFHIPILMLYYSILSLFTDTNIFYSRIPYYTGVIVAVLFNIPLYYAFEYQSLKLISKLKKKYE